MMDTNTLWIAMWIENRDKRKSQTMWKEMLI
jgi:hypothetical protein